MNRTECLHRLWTAAQEGHVLYVREILGPCSRWSTLWQRPGTLKWICRAVLVAACNDHADVVRELFQHMPDDDVECFTKCAMKRATRCGSLQVVAALLPFPGSHILVQCGLCPACNHGHADAVRLLLSAKADVNRGSDDFPGDAPLRRICGSSTCSLEILATLLSAKAEVGARDGSGPRDLVCLAVSANRPDVVRALAAAKADVDARDKVHGNTPLYDAVACKSLDMVRTLVHVRANVDKVSLQHGFTPIFGALVIPSAKRKTLRLLVSAKADVDLEADGLGTPAQFAADSKDVESLRILLRAKAHVDPQVARSAVYLAASDAL